MRAKVAQLDVVPELVGRFDGDIDGLRSLVGVARGSVGGVTGNVFEEVEERFANPSVCVHHERDEFLVHCARRGLVLTVLSTIALCDGVGSRRRLTLTGLGLASVVVGLRNDVRDGGVYKNGDASLA